MRFHQLRDVLSSIVLASAAGGCLVDAFVDAADDHSCEDHLVKRLSVDTPADPPFQFKVDSCRVDVDACPDLCQMAMERAQLFAPVDACKVTFDPDRVNITVNYTVYNGGANCPVNGRRPDSLAAIDRLDARSPAGAWLAQAAWLEAASIYAFVQLARELELHGAPARLIRWAHVAARDELRHTEVMTRLALRYGARPPVPVVALPALRALDELAIENAAEGCVRETWGAIVALYQARTARDPQVRAAFALIAADETRHAALAFAVDDWARSRLPAAACARVTAARDAAVRDLLDSPPCTPIAAIGLPTDHQARELLARSHDSLWGGVTCV